MSRSAHIVASVHVEIHYTENDDQIVNDFLGWQLKEKVFPIPGTGASSPVTQFGDGYFVGAFDVADYLAIKQWLESRGVQITMGAHE